MYRIVHGHLLFRSTNLYSLHSPLIICLLTVCIVLQYIIYVRCIDCTMYCIAILISMTIVVSQPIGIVMDMLVPSKAIEVCGLL